MATAYPGGLRKRGGLLDNEDTIQATPRNPFFGGVADLLGQAYKLPEMPRLGVPGLDFVAANRNRLMDLLGVGDVQKTAETMSYGFPVGTGTGMTYQLKPETMGAAMAVAPFAGKAVRATEGLPVGASTKLIDKIDQVTGLPLNPDGTVTLFHHTNKGAAQNIQKTGILKSAGEPSVYLTTEKTPTTGYGDTVVPVRVNPSKLNLDDEFPSGRLDFSIDVGKPGGSIRIFPSQAGGLLAP